MTWGRGRRQRPPWLLGVVGLLLALLAALPPAALAGEDWCDGDPIIYLDGQRIQILVQVPAASLRSISAAEPVVIRLYVPQNVSVAPIQYTGPVAERVDVVRTRDTAGAPRLKVHFAVYAPDPPGKTNDFPVRYTAISAIDRQAGVSWSGFWRHDAIDIPTR